MKSLHFIIWLLAIVPVFGNTLGSSEIFTVNTRSVVSSSDATARSSVFTLNTADKLNSPPANSEIFAMSTFPAYGHRIQSEASISFTLNTTDRDLLVGSLVDLEGNPVGDATIQVRQQGGILWTVYSNGSGQFEFPNYPVGQFTLVVQREGYLTTTKRFGAGGVISGDFSLKIPPLSEVPELVEAEIEFTPQEMGDPDKSPFLSRLRVFRNESWQERSTIEDLRVLIDPSKVSIFMCHGWNSNLEEVAGETSWPKRMASAITSLGLSSEPNIIGWDWRERSDVTAPPIHEAANQGREFGEALQDLLGDDYGQHIHFIGHSLGTIVNAYACDYVHGSFFLESQRPEAPWIATQTTPHITLMDEAELASVNGLDLFTSSKIYSDPDPFVSSDAHFRVVSDPLKDPIPDDAVFVDNYVSSVGFDHKEAVNILLIKGVLEVANASSQDFFSKAKASHGYCYEFYLQQIQRFGMGLPSTFDWAAESGFEFPTRETGFSARSYWYEDLDPLKAGLLTIQSPTGFAESAIAPPNLFQTQPPAFSVPIFRAIHYNIPALAGGVGGTIGNGVLEATEGTAHWVTNFTQETVQTVGEVAVETKERLGRGLDATWDRANSILDQIDEALTPDEPVSHPTLDFILIKNSTSANAFRTKDNTDLPPDAGIWLPVLVPENAQFVAFDFALSGDPKDDVLSFTVGGENRLTLQAGLLPQDELMSTDMLDVNEFAGMEVEVFFGFTGGTAVDCQIKVGGLRFISIPDPKPRVEPDQLGNNLIWPANATGWIPTYSPDLQSGDWNLIEHLESSFLEAGNFVIPLNSENARMFFRLEREATAD